ncbi:MAG: phosphoribosylglycinamide formyltransferase, partial [Candidatus Omnitrophica bacterium]|nr:phosphoribosylglycinamide formyltransferase [Candidatus Omnitrophota bacterium]
LKENNIDLIVLAGFMRILSSGFVNAYRGRIINIHPALLPFFKGEEGIKDAFNYGVKVTGVTVHFVDEEMDHGAIILQKEIRIEESDTLELLEAKIHKVEHKLYPEAIKLFAEGRLKIEGRKVRIISR